eukprot:7376254-Prymnesium_polylepis.1
MIEGPARFEFGGWGTLPKHPRPVMPHMRSDVDVCLFGRDLDTSDDFQESELTGHMKLKPTHNTARVAIDACAARGAVGDASQGQAAGDGPAVAQARAARRVVLPHTGSACEAAPHAKSGLSCSSNKSARTALLTESLTAASRLAVSAAQLRPAADPVDADTQLVAARAAPARPHARRAVRRVGDARCDAAVA